MTDSSEADKNAGSGRKKAAAKAPSAPDAAPAQNITAAAAEAARRRAEAEAAEKLEHLKQAAAKIPDSALPSSVPQSDRFKLKMLLAMFPPTRPGQFFMLPAGLSWFYILFGCFLLWMQGLSINIITTNLPQTMGYFGTSAEETTWLISAYIAPYASFTILLTKLRTQTGVRLFTIVSLVCFTLVCLLHVFLVDYRTALLLRFFGGLTAAPISSVAVLYIMTPLAPLKKITAGISIAMFNLALGMPLAHTLGTYLVAMTDFHVFCLMEFGLACMALALIHFLPPMDMPKMKVMEKLDYISFPLIALGLGLNAAVLPVGRLYWWHDADWIGWALALAIACLTVAALIELNRKNPMIDIRWLLSKEMIHITVVILSFRVLVADQSNFLSSYFSPAGLVNYDLITLYVWIGAGIIAGGLICVFWLNPGLEDYFFLIAMVAIAAGSFASSFTTGLTRPPQLYLAQMLVGFGFGMFMPVALSRGLYMALMRGTQYVVSFVAVFLFTQCTGSIASSAFFGSIQTILEKFHSYIITGHLVMSNDIVSQRVAYLAAPYQAQMTDPARLTGTALGTLAQQASRQANILAYNDVFRIYGYIAVVIIIMLMARIIWKHSRPPAKSPAPMPASAAPAPAPKS